MFEEVILHGFRIKCRNDREVNVILEISPTVILEIFYRESRPIVFFCILEWQNCYFYPTYIWRVCFTYFAVGRNMALFLVFWVSIFIRWYSKTLDSRFRSEWQEESREWHARSSFGSKKRFLSFFVFLSVSEEFQYFYAPGKKVFSNKIIRQS